MMFALSGKTATVTNASSGIAINYSDGCANPKIPSTGFTSELSCQ